MGCPENFNSAPTYQLFWIQLHLADRHETADSVGSSEVFLWKKVLISITDVEMWKWQGILMNSLKKGASTHHNLNGTSE